LPPSVADSRPARRTDGPGAGYPRAPASIRASCCAGRSLPGLYGRSSRNGEGVLAQVHASAQRVRIGGFDLDVHEPADQPFGRGEIDDAIVVGAAGQFVFILLRPAFDEDALNRPDHRLVDGAAVG